MIYNKQRVESLIYYLNSLHISDIFNEFDLKIEGRKALCPFHDETRPSLFVLETDIDNDKWFCQSCRRGGTISNFIGEYYKIFLNASNFYAALDIYLYKHKELWEILSFKTLRDFNNTKQDISLKEALDKFNMYKDLNKSKLHIDVKLLPNKYIYKDVLEYLIKLQRGCK